MESYNEQNDTHDQTAGGWLVKNEKKIYVFLVIVALLFPLGFFLRTPKWEVQNGVLTISPRLFHAKMKDYKDFGDAPWYPQKETIRAIVIKNGVKNIGRLAFEGCDNVTSVSIPNSVTSIGWSAFCICESLTSIDIPQNVTHIGEYAFAGCKELQSISIPNSVTSIGERAFNYCLRLTSLSIPSSVTCIGEGAFCGCRSLASLTIPNSVKEISEYEVFTECYSLSLRIPKRFRGKLDLSDCKSVTYY